MRNNARARNRCQDHGGRHTGVVDVEQGRNAIALSLTGLLRVLENRFHWTIRVVIMKGLLLWVRPE